MPYKINRPQNYADVQDTISLEDSLPQEMRKRKGFVTKCECERWVKAFRIIDVRSLPNEITQGRKWACDTCWTSWIGHSLRYQKTYQGRPFRELDWVELHGAPPHIVANQIERDRKVHAKLTEQWRQVRDTHANLAAQRGQTGQPDDALDRELARIDSIINRRVDITRLE